MELYKHQQEFLAANPNKSALVWSCGTGKTRTAIEWTNKHGSCLVICPKALKINWKREVSKWSKGGVYKIITKEEFRRDWESIGFYGQVIADEIHNGFLTPHFKSKMSKALRSYLKKNNIPRVLLLSATVYTSSPWNIYNLAYYLGHKLDWVKFSFTFFDQIRMGPRIVPVAKKGCEVALAKLTKSIASVVDIADCMDAPLQLHTDPEYFALTKIQEKAIKDAYDPLPIVRFTRQHEIENGVLVGNKFASDEIYDCDKNTRIVDLCEENPKIAIVCRYNAQIDVLAQLLKKHAPIIIRGDVKDRDTACRTAEMASMAVVLIQADCGLGFELPSFPVCVFASMSYSYTSKKQMEGRFLRMNFPSRTTFIYLLTEGDSIDQAIYDCMLKKEDFSIALYKK
jgi:hypothetical protein